MRLRLHPRETHLLPIEVNTNLFTIGRGEEAFAEYDRSIVARLSRRHAKLFEQDGAVYVADLNSRNGTMLNGKSVDAVPYRIADGDELEVGKLVFRIELTETPTDGVETEADVTMVLETAHEENDLTPIVVTRFPFLVSRDSEIFTPYRELPDGRAANEVEFISTKHAHFYLQDNQVYLEDLNSTNGTLLNDVKVQDQPQMVNSGDLIAFGGDYFEYRVLVLRADDSVDRTVLQDIDRDHSSEGTIFVDSPTSFIDIFDTQDKMSDQPQPSVPSIQEFPDHSEPLDSSRPEKIEPDKKAAPKPAPAPKHSGEKPKTTAKVWRYVGILLLLGAVGGGYYFYTLQPSAQKLEQVLYQGDYAEGAQIAKALLAQGSVQGETERLVTVALLRAYVPQWLQGYRAKDMAAMAQANDQLRAAGTMLPQMYDYAELLEWAGESQFLLSQSDTSASELTRVRNWWVFNSAKRQTTLERLAAYVPEASGLAESIQAQVRALR